MKNTIRIFTFIFSVASLIAAAAENIPDPSPRNSVSLDGMWEIAEGVMDQPPEKFEHQIPVPGLVALAQPPFQGVGYRAKHRDAFWYRRTFNLDEPIPAIVRLKVSKAMFGSRVLLNGKLVGDHAPSFTPGYFDLNEKTGTYEIKGTLRPGKNELLIRVGASRNSRDRLSVRSSCTER